jgi:hypothetical protein
MSEDNSLEEQQKRERVPGSLPEYRVPPSRFEYKAPGSHGR